MKRRLALFDRERWPVLSTITRDLWLHPLRPALATPSVGPAFGHLLWLQNQLN
jgi:hypothetical protein